MIGLLHGMHPPETSGARVLELGCAAGGNLIPMAATFPGMTCLGVDLSERQIREGQSLTEELGLTNIELQAQDLQELALAPASFDYIICHGVFSWVRPPVRRRILTLIRHALAPNGVAYISFNTYPGWHLREMVREMMTWHTRHIAAPPERVQQARALLQFLVQATVGNELFHGLLQRELERIRRHSDNYVFHEHLESENHGLYFHEFAALARQADLQFLGEARLSSMLSEQLPEETRATLEQLAPDLIQMEQYLDFIKNRTFRASLLCHREVPLDRAISGARLRPAFVASPLQPSPAGAEDAPPKRSDPLSSQTASAAVPVQFAHSDGSTISVREPIQVNALQLLADAWPKSLPMTELTSKAVSAAGGDAESPEACTQVEELVLKCLLNDLVEISASGDAFVTQLSTRPIASRLARAQARRGPAVTNQKHEVLHLDELQRHVLELLDGEHTVDDVHQTLRQLVVDQLLVSGSRRTSEDQPDTSEDTIRSAQECADRFLQIAAQQALLIG